MSRLIPNGNVKIVYIDQPSLGVPASISATDIANGVDVTPYVMSMAASVTAQGLPIPNMNSIFESQIAGVQQGQFQIDLYRDDLTEGGADTAWSTLTRGSTGVFVVSRMKNTIANGDYVEVWPTLVLSRAMANMTSNGILTFTVQCALTGQPNENFQITASAVPSAPSNVVATLGASTGLVTLDWDAPAQGGTITGYKVYKDTTAGGTFSTQISTNITVTGTTAALTSQAAGLTYYKIVATNATGDSAKSSVSNGVTVV